MEQISWRLTFASTQNTLRGIVVEDLDYLCSSTSWGSDFKFTIEMQLNSMENENTSTGMATNIQAQILDYVFTNTYEQFPTKHANKQFSLFFSNRAVL